VGGRQRQTEPAGEGDEVRSHGAPGVVMYARAPGGRREHFSALVRRAERGEIRRVVVVRNWVLLGDGRDCADLLDLVDAGLVRIDVANPDLVDLNTTAGRRFARQLIRARRGEPPHGDQSGEEAFEEYVEEMLPRLLSLATVPPHMWEDIARDMRARAWAFRELDPQARLIVAAPFLEDAAFHHPLNSSPWDRAFAEVVVRNSRLEDAHSSIQQEWKWWFTTTATQPLVGFLRASNASPRDEMREPAFTELQEKYPRAWHCMAAVAAVGEEGGRAEHNGSGGEVLLPDVDEVVEAPEGDARTGAVLFSAVDPRLDHAAYAAMQAVYEGRQGVLVLSSLSRISRNSAKLMRILEFYLAQGASVLTANTLLTPTEVFVRQGHWVRPAVRRPEAAFRKKQGLAPEHLEVCRRATQSAPRSSRAIPG